MVNTCITRLWQNWSRLFLDFLKPSKINWNPEVSLFEISRKKREFRYNFRSVREIWRPKVYITFILQGKKRPNRVVLAINRAIFRQDRKLKWIQAWSLLVLIATFAFRTVPGSKVTLPGLTTAYHVELLKSTICRTSYRNTAEMKTARCSFCWKRGTKRRSRWSIKNITGTSIRWH